MTEMKIEDDQNDDIDDDDDDEKPAPTIITAALTAEWQLLLLQLLRMATRVKLSLKV